MLKWPHQPDIRGIAPDLATGRQTGSPARPIQSFFGTNFEPAWSPDGKSLAYVSWRGYRPISGDPRILAIRSVDTGDTRELRPNLAYFDQLRAVGFSEVAMLSQPCQPADAAERGPRVVAA